LFLLCVVPALAGPCTLSDVMANCFCGTTANCDSVQTIGSGTTEDLGKVASLSPTPANPYFSGAGCVFNDGTAAFTCAGGDNYYYDSVSMSTSYYYNPGDTAGPGFCCLGATVGGDPHVQGPLGQKFDFDGKPGGIYNIVSTPTMFVNAKLAPNGPKERFMTQLGVGYRNFTLMFDTTDRGPMFLEKLNDLLAPVGGEAHAPNEFVTVLDFCPGHRLTIEQHVVNRAEGVFYYVDVDLELPDCSDQYGGVVGQLYKCRFKNETFAWDPATEESFRVPTLFASRGFSPSAKCPALSDDMPTSLKGGAKMK